jgi:hypothetical protein
MLTKEKHQKVETKMRQTAAVFISTSGFDCLSLLIDFAVCSESSADEKDVSLISSTYSQRDFDTSEPTTKSGLNLPRFVYNLQNKLFVFAAIAPQFVVSLQSLLAARSIDLDLN